MNKLKKSLLLFVLSFAILSNAQTAELEWIKQMKGSSDAEGLSVVADGSGNVYTTGYFEDTVDFDPGAGVANLIAKGRRNMFISKLDAFGNFVWAKKISGDSFNNSNSIAIDKNADIYFTGCFEGKVDFGPSDGIYNLTSKGGVDIFILKLNASGDFKWVKQIGGAGDDYGFTVSLDALDHLYIYGCFAEKIDLNPNSDSFFITAKDYNDIFILKLDISGEFIWAKNLSMTCGDDSPSFITDVMGNIYMIGDIRGKVDFDPGNKKYYLKSKNYSAKFILKLDPFGNFLWVKKIKTSYWDYEPNITVDIKGNVYISYCFEKTVDFDPGKGKFKLNPINGNIFILKLNKSGDFEWVKNQGGSFESGWPFAITTDSIGNVYTTGAFSETGDFDPGDGIFNLTSSGKEDIYVSKLDSSGNFIWAKSVGGALLDVGNSLILDSSGNVFVTGHIDTKQEEVKLIPETPQRTYTIYKGDIFILKLSQTNTSLKEKSDR